ncbi:MAG: hypothetical protein GYA48_00025 [Chloroflexi bacterium]|nr:hypothetical protein [Chloroflexota bacterium]
MQTVKPKDFRSVKNFPGTTGNDLDVVLHRFAKIQDINSVLLAAVLFLLAYLLNPGSLTNAALLFTFFLIDWLMLWSLPRAGLSYGPPKPPLVILALGRSVLNFIPAPWNWVAQMVGAMLVIYGFWVEPHFIRFGVQKLRSPKIKSSRPIRILHLADLHVERITSREKQLNRMVEQLKPDLILFSGDILNLSYLKDDLAWRSAREVMQNWKAPYGTYLVTGSPAVDLEENFPKIIEGLPLTWLDDQTAEVDIEGTRLQIIGLTCTHKPFEDAPRLEKILNPQNGSFSILLHHSPDLAPDAALHQIDLHLAGHTHGGQVRLPWYGAIVTGSLYGKQFEAGRYNLDQTTLYVSRGIGLEGAGAPRVRFLCPPEITLWELTGRDQ